MQKIIFISIFISLSFLDNHGIAQTDTLNQKDAAGLKQGYWIIYGKDMPEKNYPADGKIEEGNYLNDKKNGIWTIYHPDGITPRLKGHFENGRPAGNYSKFFATGGIMETGSFQNGRDTSEFKKYNELGILIEKGNYINLKRVGAYYKWYDSGCLALEKYYDSNGREEGVLNFYYDDCNVVEDSVGNIETTMQKIDAGSRGVHYKKYYLSGCLKEEGDCWPYIQPGPYQIKEFGKVEIDDTMYANRIAYYDDCLIYNQDFGSIDSSKLNISPTISEVNNKTYGPGGPLVTDPLIKNGKVFNPNGYNKIYNQAGNLWMDGEFKNSRLINGKIYKYDSDGILLKIEIWKNGAFHSDADIL